MKASKDLWKKLLQGKIAEPLASEIDAFENEIELRKLGKIDEKVFAETRLRRGAYGQRYDNGQRHDGTESRKLPFDDKPTKGPGTMWDAPGMLRIKVPFGGLNPAQIEVMAELADEYSDGIAHITTRQDFQLHFIHIENTPALMRRLGAVGITSREACGNAVRNVTGCPYAGVCACETFDITPYARAAMLFLLGHPDAQEFGRKFKPAFSGCADQACGLAYMHDIGYIAATQEGVRGFKVVVGGGLGAVPRQARVLSEFIPLEEFLPVTQAVCRIYARHGEKKNRNQARIKFLVDKWGIEKFREEVFAERAKLKPDPRWTEYLEAALKEGETALRPGADLPATPAQASENLRHWLKSNVKPQRQQGYYTATIALPLGDITAEQLRQFADIARRFTQGTIRTTVEQNFILRWVSGADIIAVYEALHAADLSGAGANNILDIVACPGTDTCKLGISSSRGLAGELRTRLAAKSFQMDQAIQNLHIKISGCFNSCSQHGVADLGFYGSSRTVNGIKVPHFQVVVGGQWDNNGGAYGLPIVAVPTKRIPDAIDRITGFYLQEKQKAENFHSFIKRVGKAPIRKLLDPLVENLPTPDVEPGLYTDWGDPRSYSIGDIGIGECSGEVVSRYQFETTAAERMVFEAGLFLEKGDAQQAGEQAYKAMLRGAKALVQMQYDDVGNDPAEIVAEFTERFHDSGLFADPSVGAAKFATYFFDAHAAAGAGKKFTADLAHQQITESQLFIDAVHSCYNRLRTTAPAKA